MSSSADQSSQWAQEQWTEEQWAQWQQYEASKSRRRQFRQAVKQFWKQSMVLQSPWLQFGLVAFAQFCCFQFPSVLAVKEAVVAWMPQWLQFEALLHTVGTIQLVQLLLFGTQWLQSIRRSCYKTSETSQVCATRMNVMEWRSCLQFAAQWHDCSLQSAYSMWQQSQLSIPACPASQWMKLQSGQPMGPSDQAVADFELSPQFREKLMVDGELAEWHEKYQFHKGAVEQYNEEEVRVLMAMDSLYWDFSKKQAQCGKSKKQWNNANSVEYLKSIKSKLASAKEEYEQATQFQSSGPKKKKCQ